MAELKPCPFCGGTNVHMSDGKYGWQQYVYCEDCNAIGPDGNAMLDCAAVWNRRAERTCELVIRTNWRPGKTVYNGWHACSACESPMDVGDAFCRRCGARVTGRGRMEVNA